jgi:hypothetical protein
LRANHTVKLLDDSSWRRVQEHNGLSAASFSREYCAPIEVKGPPSRVKQFEVNLERILHREAGPRLHMSSAFVCHSFRKDLAALAAILESANDISLLWNSSRTTIASSTRRMRSSFEVSVASFSKDRLGFALDQLAKLTPHYIATSVAEAVLEECK